MRSPKTMKSFTWHKTGISLAAVVLLTLAGCTAGNDEEDSPTSSRSAEPAPANPGATEPSDSETPTEMSDEERKKIEAEMSPGDVSEAQLDAVRDYLEVRENSESERYDDVDDWESALKKVTTKTGLKTALEMYRPEDNSNARMVAAEKKYEVRVAAGACMENPGFGSDGDSIAVQCELTDLVEDSDGLVPSQNVDNTWPYYGEQEQPTLVIAKDGNKWLVDGDYTGKAS